MHMDSRGGGRWRTFQTEGGASANVLRQKGYFSCLMKMQVAGLAWAEWSRAIAGDKVQRG